ncbi:MAG: LytTR family transcriptional regulator DNA-binding domain-containing protein [Bacteroidota bacterium]|nr:LytTR family transcriptional regulator DNA-binding domain-containing protein [Bacteroidota bacterium]
MAKYKTIIIDDEKLAREIIKKYLSVFSEFELIAECSNGFDALKRINESHPDIIFLDVQMPKITGFEMLELIEEPPVIVFTTAFDHYAIKAFEVNAADYLLKPYSLERFTEAVEKAKKRLLHLPEQAKFISKIIETNNSNIEFLQRVIIKDGGEISIIDTSDILYIEAMDDYVMIYTEDGKHIKKQTMKYFEQHLENKVFVRSHRSYIVNLTKIKRIELLEKETYSLNLLNGAKIPASKTGYDLLKEKLK